MDKMQEYGLTTDQRKAVEMIATTPGVTDRIIADELKKNPNTIYYWRKNPVFSEACFERFTELAGVKLIDVVNAMFREAQEGNVPAARLIMEHYQKLDKTLHIKVESPFDKFLNAKEIGHIDITDAVEIGNNMVLPPNMPPRNPLNDNPEERSANEEERIKYIKYEPRIIKKEKHRRNKAYHIRRRAKSVGLKPLPPGRQSHDPRSKWLKQLERLEKQNGIEYDN